MIVTIVAVGGIVAKVIIVVLIIIMVIIITVLIIIIRKRIIIFTTHKSKSTLYYSQQQNSSGGLACRCRQVGVVGLVWAWRRRGQLTQPQDRDRGRVDATELANKWMDGFQITIIK